MAPSGETYNIQNEILVDLIPKVSNLFYSTQLEQDDLDAVNNQLDELRDTLTPEEYDFSHIPFCAKDPLIPKQANSYHEKIPNNTVSGLRVFNMIKVNGYFVLIAGYRRPLNSNQIPEDLTIYIVDDSNGRTTLFSQETQRPGYAVGNPKLIRKLYGKFR
jgi:hypothetical protein